VPRLRCCAKLRATAVLITLLVLLLCSPPATKADIVNTGITSASFLAVAYGIQRKIVFDGTRWWFFVWDGSYLAYYYSTDLNTWTRSGTVWYYTPALAMGGADVRISGSTVYIAQVHYSSNYYVYFVKGAISGTSISWSSPVTLEVYPYTIYGGGLAIDTSGRIWVAVAKYNQSDTNYYFFASYSTDGGSTWVVASPPGTLSSIGGVTIVPMSGGKVMFIAKGYNTIHYSIYNDSWSPLATAVSDAVSGSGYFSVTSNGDVVYLVYTDGFGRIRFMKYTGTSWTSPAIIATTSASSQPIIEFNPSNGVLVVFWISGSTVYVACSTDDGTTWRVLTVGTDAVTSSIYITGAVQVYNNYAVLAYLTGSSPPYTVKLAYIALAPPPAPTLQSPASNWRVNPGASVNFTWVFNPTFSGDYQTAYQLQIATDSNFNNIVVDTGKVSSGNMWAVVSVPTAVGTYYWRVMVWNSINLGSPWSSAGAIIVDKVVVTLSVNTTRTDVGRRVNVSWSLRFESDNTAITSFTITIARNGTAVYSGSASSFVDSYSAVSATVYTATSVRENTYGITAFESNSVTVIWDTVVIRSISPAKPRATVGATPQLNISAVYAYDNSAFQGTVYTNATAVNTVGRHTIAVTGISDSLYGLRTFTGNTTTSIVFDKLVVQSFSVKVNGTSIASGTRINVTMPIVVEAVIVHAYDGLVLDNTNAVSVQLAGVTASWSGSNWVATIQPPGSIGSKTHTVATYAESSLGVKLVDSPTFVVVYDSIVYSYSCDLVSDSVTIRLGYASDSSALPSGRLCVLYAGSASCASVSNGVAVVRSSRAVNSTLVLVNATDSAFVSISPRASLLYTSAVKNIVYTAGTGYASVLSAKALPGLVYVKAELKGNASIIANTSLSVFLVKVNGTPTSNYVAVATAVGTNVLFTNLGSTVEVVYANSTTAVTNVGAGPGGGVFLIGFTDNYNLTGATYMIGLFVNGSVAQPFAYINGSWRFGDSFYVSFSMVPMLSFGYEGSNLTVYWVLAQARGYATGYSKGFWVSPIVASFTRMYPFLMVLNQSAIAERFGVIPSAFASYLTKNAISISVLGPYPAELLVTTIAVVQPIQIVYSGSDIRVVPSQAPGLTFVGFKGFRLSIAIGNIQLQNIEVAQDSMTLYLPVGFTALLVVDTASKTISLTQMALPQPPGALTPVPTSIPVLAPPPTSVQLTEPASAIQYSILIATFTAIALAIWRRTGDFGYGVAVAGVAGAIIALVLGNGTAVAVALMVMGIGIAVSIYERRA